ncbi:MAG: hypothetical protein ACLFQB_07365 [Chitinispirillaceae bacterium]
MSCSCIECGRKTTDQENLLCDACMAKAEHDFQLKVQCEESFPEDVGYTVFF